MLYSKTNFNKSQPPWFPPHLGGGLSHKPDYHKTPPPLPPYNNVVLYFKTIFYKRQPPQFPQQLGWGYLTNWTTTKLHLPLPLTMTPCYIFSNKLGQNLTSSIPPNTWGLSHKSDYHKTSPPPPFNDVVLYSKTNFNKSQPPRFPQHLGGLSHKPDYHKTPPPLPPYNNVVLYFKTIFYKRQPPQFPQQLGGGYLTNRTTTKLHLPLPPLQWCCAIF